LRGARAGTEAAAEKGGNVQTIGFVPVLRKEKPPLARGKERGLNTSTPWKHGGQFLYLGPRTRGKEGRKIASNGH